MGWYTEGPGELRYKYGDAVGAARASGIGRLSVIPRVLAQTADDIVDAEFEFMGLLQVAIQKLGLPWQAFDFDLEVDPSGESMVAPADTDPFALLGRIAEAVGVHARSVIRALEDEAGESLGIESLTVTIEFSWEVAADERGALLAWLNDGRMGEAAITDELLRSGELDDDWYEPPAALEQVFSEWQAADAPRHLAACAHACALLSGERFFLHQPDDDHQVAAWNADGAPGFVLFTPARYPFIDLLAEWLGVSRELRQRVFYIHANVGDYELPPEEDLAEADEEAGHHFLWFLAKAVSELSGARLLGPKDEDGDLALTLGWHMAASSDHLSEIFAGIGLLETTLDDILEDELGSAFLAASSLDRLSLLREAAESSRADLEYVLGQGPQPPAPQSATMGILVAAIRDVELPSDVLARIGELVRAIPRD